MTKSKNILLILVIFVSLFSCKNQDVITNENNPQGKLFIIGGGKRPTNMIKDLIQLSNVDSNGYIIILPMSSEFPDTAAFYGLKQFKDLGLTNVFALNFQTEKDMSQEKLDSVRNAKLIYISGGDQNKFMKVVANTPVFDAIHYAYNHGAVISGTSAGAAVMSEKMISGNENKHPEYTGNFRTIEANNVEVAEGLGLIKKAIIDQHFVKRMRMNRLISVSLENPEETCIGIDESTAILVEGNNAKVYGISQVIVIRHKSAETKVVNGLLGAENMELNVYLPGDSFQITE